MIRLTLRELAARRRRLLGSFFAVFLGVAFLSGTLVLGNTLDNGITSLIGRAYEGTDVSVRNAADVADQPGTRRGNIDAGLLGAVKAVPGVAAAEPVIQGVGEPTKKDGKTIGVQGPRTAGNWIADPNLTPWRVAEGRAPAATGEVMIDRRAAKDGDLKVGDRTYVLVPDRVAVTVVGIMSFGEADTIGGTSFVAFTYDDARRNLLRDPTEVTSIVVESAAGLAGRDLAERIQKVLPDGVEAITGEDVAAENIDAVGTFLDIVRAFLAVFAVVSLLVAAFSIHNTFAIVVAQRTREAALLRALGASRRQILGGVLLEAALLGVAGSLTGAVAGYGLAGLLKRLFSSMGFGPPTLDLSYDPGPLMIAVPAGILITLTACLVPAVQAGRVTPLEALRATAAESPGRLRTPAGSLTALAGTALLVLAVATENLGLAGAGAALVLVATVVLGPFAVRPFVSTVGGALPGTTAGLAGQNALRNPRRTAGAATSLMIGVGVVALFTVFAASLSATVERDAEQAFTGDLVVDAGGFGNAGFSPRLEGDVAALPQVEAAAGLGTAQARVNGAIRELRIADPVRLSGVLRLDRLEEGLAVSAESGLAVGTPVRIEFPDGAVETLHVASVYRPIGGFSDYVIPRTVWTRHVPQALDARVYVLLRDGVTALDGKTAVERAAALHGSPAVQTRAEFVEAQTEPVRNLLVIVYVMLALAIVIALMGIANTLSLAIHERTRELGLLRAVGATRQQVKSMIRWESLLVALFGTFGGVLLGVGLGWVMAAAGGSVFALPVLPVVIVLTVGAGAGVLAAIRPAGRAARLPMITALAES